MDVTLSVTKPSGQATFSKLTLKDDDGLAVMTPVDSTSLVNKFAFSSCPNHWSQNFLLKNYLTSEIMQNHVWRRHCSSEAQHILMHTRNCTVIRGGR